MPHIFPDRIDTKCYLVVEIDSDGLVSMHGWNENTDNFTAIDLSPADAAKLAGLLRSAAALP